MKLKFLCKFTFPETSSYHWGPFESREEAEKYIEKAIAQYEDLGQKEPKREVIIIYTPY